MEHDYRDDKPDNKSRKPFLSTKSISLSGIFMIFVLVFLFLAGSATNIQMISYCFSSLFIMIILEESTIVAGISFYVASSLLALLILPNKLALIPYILFFGHFGIWYHLFDKSKRKYLHQALNYIIANISIFTIYFACKELFVNLKIPSMILFIPVVEIFIILYHYMYGRCLHYYRKDIKSKL